ncbi:MAG: DUF998 domain-containing protein, partial [Dehalococcoidales bacterium]|nr:DUF998 domain-containing protein [Dehalococcoidales bacterium]
MSRRLISRIFSVFGIVAPVIISIIVIIAGLLTPGFNQMTDTISSLSQQGSKTPQLLTIGFVVYGVLVIGFAYSLYINLRHGIKARIAWLMLTLYGICMILAAVFQDSPGGNNAPLNTEGIFHNALIIVS